MMKIRKDFVTNSSSTSYIFAAKDVDTIINEIRERMIFGKYTEQLLSELEKEGFNRVLDKVDVLDKVAYIIEYWEDMRYESYPSFSANIHEVLNNSEALDDKLIVKIMINYQGDGHNHGCIRDDDWYHRMEKSGRMELVEGIFEDDFMGFFWW